MIKRRAQMGGPQQRNELGCEQLRPANRLRALSQMGLYPAFCVIFQPPVSLVQIPFSAEKADSWWGITRIRCPVQVLLKIDAWARRFDFEGFGKS
jgi:hypothetical protein